MYSGFSFVGALQLLLLRSDGEEDEALGGGSSCSWLSWMALQRALACCFCGGTCFGLLLGVMAIRLGTSVDTIVFLVLKFCCAHSSHRQTAVPKIKNGGTYFGLLGTRILSNHRVKNSDVHSPSTD
uniref:Uncharacterized protein n=1 Tax=Cryptomonas curvata TaxID=233186 RepID=A0A6T8EC05_9CRYP|mmetsp:Transcript_8234/g.17663  ORF Transcript_8234/g.17663 Transcript_8234/m.17663 type:complete len:126 (+) Transcript_8234:148-525(+)